MKKDHGTGDRHIQVITAALVCLLATLTACTYKDRVAPINLPQGESSVVVGRGLKIAAQAYTDPKQAEQAFGFDALKAGLLPVQLTFQNDSPDRVMVNPDQTFLIDQRNKAWPVLSLERTYQRTMGQVDIGETAKGTAKPALLLGAAGAIAGAAVGIITGENIGNSMGKGAAIGAASGAILGGAKSYGTAGEKIRDDLAAKSLRNEAILPRQIAYGVIFFPGMPGEEAAGARELRLGLTIAGSPRVVKINLTGR